MQVFYFIFACLKTFQDFERGVNGASRRKIPGVPGAAFRASREAVKRGFC